MTELPEILHNIADHTQTLLRLLGEPATAPDVVLRLKQHMLLEEKENSAKLQELQEQTPLPVMQKLLDHSFFLQRMMQEESMSGDLQYELLDHFMEEHQAWTQELSPASGGSLMESSSHGHGQSHGQEHGQGQGHGHGQGHSPGQGRSRTENSSADSVGKNWTVGPLWPQGG